MEDGASEISDWEVLSAASAAAGDEDVILVFGEGGDVLHDHFALDSSPVSGEGYWSEAVSSDGEDKGPELLDSRFDSVSREEFDLHPVDDSSVQLQVGMVDETAQGAVLQAAAASTSSAEESKLEASDVEIEHEERNSGEFDSIPQAAHQGEGHILDFHSTAVAAGESQIEPSEISPIQLEDEADASKENSVLKAAAATSDAMESAHEEELEQVEDHVVASDCSESDGEAKDASSPLVEIPGAGDGKRQLVVWWRLPLRLLHYCAWKVKPVWSISIAAALLGLVVLGRRMYRMRRKTRGMPQIKIELDEKRASQFAARAARLNEAFLIAKRVPALRTSSGAALPWSIVQER